MMYGNEVAFDTLKGKTITKLVDATIGSERVGFECSDGTKYRLVYHHDCCAGCDLNEVHGDLEDLIGSPILMAEEVTGGEEVAPAPEHAASFTWCFYKLATIKGYVTLRFLGQSNGNYSETMTFEVIK